MSLNPVVFFQACGYRQAAQDALFSTLIVRYRTERISEFCDNPILDHAVIQNIAAVQSLSGAGLIERITRKLTHITLLAAALYAAGACADDLEAPLFSFSGFGTLGVVHSSEDQADFTSSIFKPDGAGYSHAWSADVDSLIGGQVTASFTPKLSAVLQVIAEQNYDDTYQPHVEWANIQYQFTPEFQCTRRSHRAAYLSVFRYPQSGLYLSLGASAAGGLSPVAYGHHHRWHGCHLPDAHR